MQSAITSENNLGKMEKIVICRPELYSLLCQKTDRNTHQHHQNKT